MVTVFDSAAERQAQNGVGLPSFALNLPEIKRTVEQILSQFGRGNIFNQYTVHDIAHINDMLKSLDWLITEQSRRVMSSGDWIMIVLGIYFHDMGLIVTDHEYAKRNYSSFSNFCDDILFSAQQGKDYRAKIDSLPDADREKFLYQEFVRFNHGKRVRSWIEARPDTLLGAATSQVAEIDRLLSGLDPVFRRDLGLVCESHNLDDLENIGKYKLSQPYGDSEDETVNLQFCAIILRTVDLIQITRGRAPAVLYRLINPTDPTSQLEWAKQSAVRRIRPKPAVDRDGNATDDIQSDTIEVFASFQDGNAYFGLGSYLRYARSQIISSHNLVISSRKYTARKYHFPWRDIDDSNIEVDGCEPKPFGFEIDQEKVLELLTGHTLYNDSAVVVREIVQNAIDAVRLMSVIAGTDSFSAGSVRVLWNSKLSELEIIDNGTGMTQEIIEKHLLKVGSSRYQDVKFKEKFSEFHSISRFGIGVLSSFMVADAVEIITVNVTEDRARKISLRSVHGKYLVELLDKGNDSRVKRIGKHGTSFRLRFRSTAQEIDVRKTLQKWIMFPRCNVSVQVDNEAPSDIGFRSPKDALSYYIENSPAYQRAQFEVREIEAQGVTLAFVVMYDSHYRDWTLVSVDSDSESNENSDYELAPIATCIEGIAVEFESPGFSDKVVLSVANAIGVGSPRTNVARSAMEATQERDRFFETIYSLYFQYVEGERKRLVSAEGYSLTWAIEQIPFIMGSLSRNPKDSKSHNSALARLPTFIVESEGRRQAMSWNELSVNSEIWTIDSQLTRSIEQVVREARSEITAGMVLTASQGGHVRAPLEHIIANIDYDTTTSDLFRKRFEVSSLCAYANERRIDLGWSERKSRWLERDNLRKIISRRSGYTSYLHFMQNIDNRNTPSGEISAPIGDIAQSGLDGYLGVKTYAGVFLLPNNPISDLVLSYHTKIADGEDAMNRLVVLLDGVDYLTQRYSNYHEMQITGINSYFRIVESRLPPEWSAGRGEMVKALMECGSRVILFDPSAWSKRRVEEIFDVNIPF